MRFTVKGKSSNEGWETAFLLLFSPEDQAIGVNNNNSSNLPSSSSSSSSATCNSKSTINTIRRSSSNHLLSRAQSTISICALLIFITLLFTLSNFEPSSTTTHFSSRRYLSSNPPSDQHKQSSSVSHSPSWFFNFFSRSSRQKPEIATRSYALQRMGTLYRRGTKAMKNLVVVHVEESVTAEQLRFFLKLHDRSGLPSRSDLVFIFPSSSHSVDFESVIREGNESFWLSQEANTTAPTTSFDGKSGKTEKQLVEPIWGKRIRSNYSDEGEGELTRLKYGSVVSFLVDELDPENSLAGFLDHVPMSLRRWACYPMLLGRVRRNFKHIMLVDPKEMLLVGDPFRRVRSPNPESVLLWNDAAIARGKIAKKSSPKTPSESHKPATPAIMVGSARGIRRLSSTMLVEIVRATTEHKKKSPVTESRLLNQLVAKELLLKNVHVAVSSEPIPEASSFAGLSSNSGSSLSLSNYIVIRRGNSNVDTTLPL